MNHQPFEDWLLNETSLNPQQKRDLNVHLLACRACAALAEVNLAFRAVRQVEPARGFSERFQRRLVERKQALRRRNVVGFGLLAVGVVAGLVWVTFPWLRAAVHSPIDLLTTWVSSLVGLWATVQAVFRAVLVLFRVAPGFVSISGWAMVLAVLAVWGALSALSIMKFARERRLVS